MWIELKGGSLINLDHCTAISLDEETASTDSKRSKVKFFLITFEYEEKTYVETFNDKDKRKIRFDQIKDSMQNLKKLTHSEE